MLSQCIFDETSEILAAIADAKKGLLAPHWQQYHIRELQGLKGTPFYPEDGDNLLKRLKAAIASREQISDFENARKQLALIGTEILFYFSKDYATSMEINYTPKTRLFSCDIGVDWEISYDLQLQRIREMKTALEKWIYKIEPCFKFTSPVLLSSEYVSTHFRTLSDAVNYVYAQLSEPEKSHLLSCLA